MTNSFEVDPYPGNPKILFIGLGCSSHTHSWIDLLAGAKINVRMFSVPNGGTPPHTWNVCTYLCDPSSQLPQGLNSNIRKSLYAIPEEVELTEKEVEKRNFKLRKNIIYWLLILVKKIINSAGFYLKMPVLNFDYSNYADLKFSKPICDSPDQWLGKIIQNWRPDIIHTLGLFDGQGGLFYSQVRDKYGLKGIGKWILQLRGGLMSR